MRKLMMALAGLVSLTVKANSISTALDAPNLEFEEGKVSWTVRTDGAKVGPSYLRSGVTSPSGCVEENPYISTVLSGPGTLTFWWKRGGKGNGWCCVYGNDWRTEYEDYRGPQSSEWQQVTIRLRGSDEHYVEWAFSGYWSSSACLDLDGVRWTPAEDSVSVRFSGVGTSGLEPQTYWPGEKYGDLPVPAAPGGYQFDGWYADQALSQKVDADDFVDIEDHVLYAKWVRPLSALKVDGISFSSGADPQWQAVMQQDGLSVLDVALEGKLGYPKYDPCDSELQPIENESTLEMSVSGPGYLKFREEFFRNGGWGWFPRVEIDGESKGCHEDNGVNYVFVDAGRHTVGVTARGQPNWWQEGRWDETTGQWKYDYLFAKAPVARISQVSFEPQTTPVSLADWSDKLDNYEVWNVGALAKFKGEYARRMAADKGDCEARVLHAFTVLAELAENREFTGYLASFGSTFDYLHCRFEGEGKFDSMSPAANKMADSALKIGGPAIETALADLDGIPADWSGTVKLSANAWPVDEDIYIDRADVLFAKASLKGMLATLNFVAGYDMTTEWAKGYDAVMGALAIPLVKSIPEVDDAKSWSQAPVRRIVSERFPRAKMRLLRSAGTMAVLYEGLDFDWDVDWANIRLETEDGWGIGIDIWGMSAGGWIYDAVRDEDDELDDMSVSSEHYGDRLLVLIEMPRNSKIGSKEWALDEAEFDFTDGKNWEYNVEVRVNRAEVCYQNLVDTQTQFFSKVRNASKLKTARKQMIEGLQLTLDADALAMKRAHDGKMHFVEYDFSDSYLPGELNVARKDIQLAIDSLRSAVSVDARGIADEYEKNFPATRPATDYFDFRLLPGNGVTRVYLGALFDGKVTRSLLPHTRLNEYGEIVPNFESFKDVTFGGLLPDMTAQVVRNLADTYFEGERDYGPVDPTPPPEEFALFVGDSDGYELETGVAITPIDIVVTGADTPKVSAKGLPTGLKVVQDKATGAFSISGKPTKSGVFAASLTVTTKDRKTLTEDVRFVVRRDNEFVLDVVCDTALGKVTGAGVFAEGKKATVKATSAKGYVFAGWYFDEDFQYPVDLANLDYRTASYAFEMPSEELVLCARFLPEAEDRSIAAFLNDEELSDDAEAVCVTVAAEDDLPWLEVESLSVPNVTVKGVPTGVKWDAKANRFTGSPTKPGVYKVTVSLTNVSVKKALVKAFTIEVPNLVSAAFPGLSPAADAYPLTVGCVLPSVDCALGAGFGRYKVKVSGLPSGLKYDAKSGKITGVASKAGTFTVTFTATSGKDVKTSTVTMTVTALPEWVVGTFTGGMKETWYEDISHAEWDCTDYTIFSLTVSSAGKCSLKWDGIDSTDEGKYVKEPASKEKIVSYELLKVEEDLYCVECRFSDGYVGWIDLCQGDWGANAYGVSENVLYDDESYPERDLFARLVQNVWSRASEKTTLSKWGLVGQFDVTDATEEGVANLRAKVSEKGAVTLTGTFDGKGFSASGTLLPCGISAKDGFETYVFAKGKTFYLPVKVTLSLSGGRWRAYATDFDQAGADDVD